MDKSDEGKAVPREPTDAMYRAGMQVVADAVDNDSMPSPFAVWHAMFGAAPQQESRRRSPK